MSGELFPLPSVNWQSGEDDRLPVEALALFEAGDERDGVVDADLDADVSEQVPCCGEVGDRLERPPTDSAWGKSLPGQEKRS